MLKIASILLGSAFVAVGSMATSIVTTASSGIFTSEQNTVHRTAYGPVMASLSQNQFLDHSEALFQRADLDANGVLDVDEYTTLQLVKAELAHLNGFIAIEVDSQARRLKMPVSRHLPSYKGYSNAERYRVDAIARQQFYAAAGQDQFLSWAEAEITAVDTFKDADSNLDGVLRRGELKRFVTDQAMVAQPTSS